MYNFQKRGGASTKDKKDKEQKSTFARPPSLDSLKAVFRTCILPKRKSNLLIVVLIIFYIIFTHKKCDTVHALKHLIPFKNLDHKKNEAHTKKKRLIV